MGNTQNMKGECKGREFQGNERIRNKEVGENEGASTNTSALMASLAVYMEKQHTSVSLQSVKCPQLAVSSCHGYTPHTAIIVQLSPLSTEVCFQFLCHQDQRRDFPLRDPTSELRQAFNIIREMSFQLMMLPHHLSALLVCLLSDCQLFVPSSLFK